MRGPACIRAASLIAKRTAGLSDAERLRLEQHVDVCAACGADARDLGRLAALARSRTLPELGARTRERAIAGALHALGANAEPDPARRGRWLPVGVAATFAAAAVAAVAVVAVDRGAVAPSPPTAVAVAPVAAVPSLATGERVEVAVPTELAVGESAVRLEAGTAVKWQPEARTLRLHAGRVRATLAQHSREPFRIETGRFVAEGAGAELEVTPVSVAVIAGTARVFAPDGEVYVDELVAGEVWRAPPPARDPEPSPDVDAVLTDARRRIALGELAAARRQLAAALAAGPSRRQRAEAETLLAECALVAGEPDRAAELYLRVARRYHDIPAGENALFAAAGIRANAGQRAPARRALRLYLDRYPEGRFRFEARARLDALDRGLR